VQAVRHVPAAAPPIAVEIDPPTPLATCTVIA
jgi:hypothetical protein